MKRKFLVAMYLRLSRDDEDKDGISKAESNSISSQRELIRSFLSEQEDMELFDCYVDDGFSGSNFDRPEFNRMISDMEAGRANCVVVKDLSRFGRDYIEAGRYLERVFPSWGVRFIALTDHYDSFSADSGERNIVLPVKNFINDSYCRDISTKVKSQFAVKWKAGECLAPFAVYGYLKDKENKNKLVVDEYASGVVRSIFRWKMEGLAVSAIAEKLNSLGILSPKEYKTSIGLNFRGGFGGRQAKWGSTAVKRILTNEVYLGNLLQGKTEKINYKVNKSIEKPREEWIKAENTHEPVISQDDFLIVQNLLKTDGRKSPGRNEQNLFSGLLFCGDCNEQMIRRVNRNKACDTVYYICSSHNRGEGCSRHSIEEGHLKEIVGNYLRLYANSFLEQEKLFGRVEAQEINFQMAVGCNREIARLRQEQDKYYRLCAGLYDDLRQGIITKEEFERLHGEFKRKGGELSKAQEKQESLIRELFRAGAAAAGRIEGFRKSPELSGIDRHTLASMVKKILVYEDKRVEIEFYYISQYQIMSDYNTEMAKKPEKERRA